jgi:hypothetical protein
MAIITTTATTRGSRPSVIEHVSLCDRAGDARSRESEAGASAEEDLEVGEIGGGEAGEGLVVVVVGGVVDEEEAELGEEVLGLVGGGGEGGGWRHDALLQGFMLPVAGEFGERGLLALEEARVVL